MEISPEDAGKRDIIESLYYLSDKEKQLDQWMNPNTPGMYSLEEADHALWDGLARVRGTKMLEELFSDSVCSKLKKLDEVTTEIDSKELAFSSKNIDHPKMVEMRNISSELLAFVKEEFAS